MKRIKILLVFIIMVLLITVPCFNVNAQTTEIDKNSAYFTNGSKIEIGVDESVELNLNAHIESDLIFNSSNDEIVQVDERGIVVGINKGTATVSANHNDEKIASCEITVKDKPKNIKITNSNNVIQKGSNNHLIEYRLSNNSASYSIKNSIQDTKIATVDKNGYVVGKKCGKTTLTIKTYNGITAKQELIVQDNSLSLNANSTQIALDNKNVKKEVYGFSYQNRNLEAFTIVNPNYDTSLKQECSISCKGSVNVRSGAGTSYSIIKSLKNGTKVTRIAKSVKKANGYTWDKIVFNDKQEGYIATNYLKLEKDKTKKYKVIFIDFAIHGFEDEYYRDGQALVEEANSLIEYFANNPTELSNCKLIIVPCVNTDGTIAGKNNERACSSAFGRCTANHIDMNRDWVDFKAVETRKLRDYIKKCSPNIYLNVHGWLDESIGDANLNKIIAKNLGLSKKINNYPTQAGYAIDWVHKNLKIPASLIEYKSSSTISTKKDISLIKELISTNVTNVTTTSQSYPTPIIWKNGSSSEKVYKISDLSQKIDSLKAKTTAKCYGKAGNAYIIVYSSNSKHKAGFVKYSGGVSNPPKNYRNYKNKSSSTKVYADTSKKIAIGSLDANESCKCLGKIDDMYLVVYNVSGSSKQKCGFVTYNGIK